MSKQKQDELREFRCSKCEKLLAKIKGKAEIKCPRCKTMNIISIRNA